MKLDVNEFSELPVKEVYRMEAEARNIWRQWVSESGRSPVLFVAKSPEAIPFVEAFERFKRCARETHQIHMRPLVKGMIVKLDEDED